MRRPFSSATERGRLSGAISRPPGTSGGKSAGAYGRGTGGRAIATWLEGDDPGPDRPRPRPWREAFAEEGVACLLAGDADTGKSALPDYINATIGLSELGGPGTIRLAWTRPGPPRLQCPSARRSADGVGCPVESRSDGGIA